MPNWKKLIVSGSDALLNSLNVSNDLTVSGDIAVGSSPPSSAALGVDGNIKGSGYLLLNDTNNQFIFANPAGRTVEIYASSSITSGDPAFRIRQDNAAKVDFGWDDDGTSEAFIWNYSNGGFKIGTNGTERFKITADGKVGIGTSTPSQKFEVAGVIHTTGSYFRATNDSADALGLSLASTTTGVNVTFDFEVGDTGISGLHSKNLVIRGSSGASDIAFSPSTSTPGLMILDGSAGTVIVSGSIDADDITIDDWGSVSASLSTHAQALTNNIDGSGTANYVAKFSDSNTLTTSLIQDNGTSVGINAGPSSKTLYVDGTGQFTGELFASHLDILGTAASRFRDDVVLRFGTNRRFGLRYNSTADKLQFISSSNSLLTLDGDGNATFAGNVAVVKGSATVRVEETGGADVRMVAGGSTGYIGNYSNDQLYIMQNGASAITIDTSKNATFAGNVILGANYIGRDSHNIIDFATDNHITFKTDQSTALQIDSNQSVKVVAGSLQISGDNANFTTLTESGNGDFTIAAVDDIRLDAGGGDIVLRDDGSEFARFSNGSQNLQIRNITQDKDIIFKGNDGGTTIDALRLDMSDQGWAHFNSGIAVGNSGATSTFAGDVTVAGTLTAQEFKSEFVSASIVYQSGSTKFGDTSDDVHSFSGSLQVTGSGAHYFTDGKVVVGSTTSNYKFGVTGGHIGVSNGGNIYVGGFGGDAVIGYMGNSSGVFTLRSDGNRDISIGSGTVNNSIFIEGSNGNVGIDNTSPGSKLQIGKSYQTTTGTHKEVLLNMGGYYSTSSGRQYSVIGFTGTTVDSTDIYAQSGSETSKNFYAGLVSDAGYFNGSRFSLIQSGSERFTVAGPGNFEGNVGLGVSDPRTKLHIAGSTAAASGIRQSRDGVKIWTQEIDSNGKLQWAYRSTEAGSATQHFTLNDTGAATLHLYGSGNYTGTLAYTLGVDSSGNLIEFSGGSGGGAVSAVTAGADNRVAVFNGTDSLEGDADLVFDGSKLGIGTTTPAEKLHIQGSANGNVKALIENTNTGTNAYATLGFQSDENHSVQPGLFLNGANNTNYAGASSLNMYQHGNFPLGFVTSNTIRMTVAGDGNVGIGTITPSSKLHIESTGEALRFTRSGQETYRVIHGTSGLYFTAPNAGDLLFGITQNSDVDIFNTSGDVMFRADGSTGRVGIGTTAPGEQLEVSGSILITDIGATRGIRRNNDAYDLRLMGGTSLTDGAYISLGGDLRGGAGNAFAGKVEIAQGGAAYANRAAISSSIAFNAVHNGGTVTDMSIDGSTGNVGIGTTSPSHLLSINGTVNTKQQTFYLGTTGQYAAIGAQRSPTNLYCNSEIRFINENNDTGAGAMSFGTGLNTISEAMRITSTGKVGIGTTAPSAVLQISTTMTSSPTSNIFLDVDGSNVTGGGGAIIFGTSATAGSTTSYNAKITGTRVTGGSGGDSQLGFWTTLVSDSINPQERMTITKEGNVGIGTTSPARILHIDAGATNEAVRIESTDTEVALELKDSTGTAVIRSRGDFRFDGSSGEVVRFESGGDVGIGTNNPGYKLDVAGDINTSTGLIRRAGNGIIKSSGAETMIGPGGSGIITFHNSATMTTSDETARIDANGNLLLNNTSAGARLDIREDTNYAIRAEDASGHYFRVNTGGDVDMRGDLTVQGILTAQEFHTEFVSASIIYESGSTKFGDTQDDNHDFTGSLNVSGSVVLGDNTRLNFGDDKDFHIRHNGGGAYLTNSTGDIQIQNDTDGGDIIFKSDDGSGGTTQYFRLDGGSQAMVINKNLRAVDNVRIDVGGATDGRFFHDGTDTHLRTITGNLIIDNLNDDGDIIFTSDNGSGGTTEYFRLDGGDARMYASREIRFVDGVASKYGNSGDLGIYHDGSNSIIDNNTGDLIIRSDGDDIKILAEDDVVIRDNDDSTEMAKFINGGAVELYHNGSKKIETTSTGATVTGNLTVTNDINATGDLDVRDIDARAISASSHITGSDVHIDDWGSVSASLSSIQTAGGVNGTGTAGKLPKWSDSDTLTDSIISEGTNTIQILSDGAGAAGAILELKHANNNSTDVCGTINLTNNTGGYAAIEGGTTGANNTGYLAFKTDNAGTQGEAMRIIGNGNVGIGYDAPYDLLHIHNSTNSGTPDAQMNFTTGVTGAVDGNGFRVGWNGTVANLYLFENADMRFATNNNEKMRIKSDGKVGIGTTDPGKKLHVAGEISGSAIQVIGGSSTNKFYSTSTGPIAEFKPSDTRSGMQPIFLYRSTVNGSANYILANGSTTLFGLYDSGVPSDLSGMVRISPNNSSEAPNIRIGDAGSNGAYLDIGGNIKLLNNGTSYINGGNVGIGTTSPNKKLHVAGAVEIDTTLFLDRIGGSANIKGTGEGHIVIDPLNSSHNVYLSHYVAGNVYMANGGGYVGIGTTNPSAKLDIEGDLQVKDVNISNQSNNDVDTGTETIATVVKANHDAAFFDYVVKNGTNLRAGTVMAVHDGTNVEFTDNSTKDIGDTSGVTFSVDISGTDLRLRATTTSDNWIIKSLVRSI